MFWPIRHNTPEGAADEDAIFDDLTAKARSRGVFASPIRGIEGAHRR